MKSNFRSVFYGCDIRLVESGRRVGLTRRGPAGGTPRKSRWIITVKFYATLELLELMKDRTWLAKVTNALNQYWQQKNCAKKSHLEGSFQNLHTLPTHPSLPTVA